MANNNDLVFVRDPVSGCTMSIFFDVLQGEMVSRFNNEPPQSIAKEDWEHAGTLVDRGRLAYFLLRKRLTTAAVVAGPEVDTSYVEMAAR